MQGLKNRNINIEELMEKKKDKEKSSSSKNDYGIIIDGVNNTLIRLLDVVHLFLEMR